MAKPKLDTEALVSLPSREAIGAALLAEESSLVESLIARARVNDEERRRTEHLATTLVEAARAGRHETGGVEFLSP